MQKFEYTSIKMKPKTKAFSQELEDDKLIEEMNVLGKRGWELVTSIDNIHGSTVSIVLIFKRPIE